MSNSQTKEVLIIDSSIVQRRKLTGIINQSGFLTNILEATSVAEAKQLLKSKDFDICFIGAGLSEETQCDLISSPSKNAKCVILPIAKRFDKEKVIRYISLGAHGVLLTPVQTSQLKQVLKIAFDKIE